MMYMFRKRRIEAGTKVAPRLRVAPAAAAPRPLLSGAAPYGRKGGETNRKCRAAHERASAYSRFSIIIRI